MSILEAAPGAGASKPGFPNRRLRAVAGYLVAGLGAINLISAALPPLRKRIELLRDVPLVLTHAANAVVVVAGVALLVLARQLSRGRRRAWQISLALLASSVVLHIIKGLDFEEAALAGGIAVFLVLSRRQFTALSDPASWRRIFVVAPGMIAADYAYGVGSLYARRLVPAGWSGFWAALADVSNRLIGLDGVIALRPHRFSIWFPLSLAGLGMFTIAYAAWLAFRPVLVATSEKGSEQRARDLVGKHGSGTLDYFLLRDDKSWFFEGQCVIGYRTTRGFVVASGDPVGPVQEWKAAIASFIEWAHLRGWAATCLGAGEEAVAMWREAGLRALYVGDEAVVHLGRFSLDGRPIRKVRQAVAHVEKEGFVAEWHRTAGLSPDLRRALLHISDRWKGDDIERGFSMTLGRLFDPRDPGCLVAVARDSSGEARGFLHFIPVGDSGFSLDVMRRDRQTPWGLNEFLLAKTFSHLRDEGFSEVSLNFAFLADVFHDPRAKLGPWRRFQRWLALRLGPWFQIESLYRFNKKFFPEWRPRYVAFEDVLSVPAVAIAALSAEKLIDLKILQRGQGGKRLKARAQA